MFDVLLVHVAGGGMGSFNHRFAQPSRDGHPHLNTLYPTDVFPFTDGEQEDPETGAKDSLLGRALAANVVPKIFYTNSSYEYWGRAASLIHTSADGKRDAPLGPSSRSYFFAGGQHGPAAFPPAAKGTPQPSNPNPYTWSMRALLGAMDAWVRDGKEPPASRYPRIADDNLVALGALQFPKIPGVSVPTRPKAAWRGDYSVEPPKIGKPFPVLVAQVDADGNETSGVRMPAVQVPLATYTGWNLRTPELGAPTEMNSMIGSWIPFARTEAERRKKRDPRPPVEARYKSREEYLTRVETAARDLARAGYLLEGDVPALVKYSAQEWDFIMR